MPNPPTAAKTSVTLPADLQDFRPATPLSLLDNAPAAYAKIWPVFRSRSDQRNVMIEWWKKNAQGIAKGRTSLSVLSVGCGNGTLDSEFITNLLPFAPTIRFFGCEPNPSLAGDCRDRLGKLVEAEVVECTWEAYQGSRQFDIVLISHSLYYTSDQRAAIIKGLDSRTSDGDLIIFNATDRGLAQIRGLLTTRLTGLPYKYFTSAELNRIMAPRVLPQELLASQIDVSHQNGDALSDDPLLLSFLTDCDLTEADSMTIEVVRKTISNFVEVRDGKVIVNHPVVAFWDHAAYSI
jgi:SAM-dependent methyltransferase